MTIIKQGNPNKLELRKFCCPNCGCEFIANCREYETVTQYKYYYEIQHNYYYEKTGLTIQCACPYCSRLVEDGVALSESEIQQYQIKESEG